jgi:hypothetical protein
MKMIRNATEFGVKAGSSIPSIQVNSRAIQSGVDALGKAGGGTLYFPEGEYYMMDTVLVPRNVNLDGASSIAMFPPLSYHMFLYGVDPKPFNVPFRKECLIDCFGIMDSYSVPRSGVRYGLDTLGKMLFTSVVSPLQYGPMDFWQKTDQLTVEMKVNIDTSTDGIICGLFNFEKPDPFKLYHAHEWLYCDFRTSDGVIRTSRTQIPNGLMDLSVNIDLKNALVYAYASPSGNAKRLDMTVWQAAQNGFTPGNKLTFSENYDTPFGIGCASKKINNWSDYHYNAPVSTKFYGLKLSNKVKYVGATQTRVDGAPINDWNRYYLNEKDTIAYLPGTRSPDDVAGNLTITGMTGGACGPQSLYFSILALSPEHGNIYTSAGPNKISNLTLRNSSVGIAVGLGNTLDMTCDHVNFTGGRGISSMNMNVNYVHKINTCSFNCSDAGIYLEAAMANANDLTFIQCGRNAIRSYGQLDVQNMMINGFGAPEDIIRGAGYLTVRGMFNIDFEGNDRPQTYITWDTGSEQPLKGLVDIQFLSTGTQPSGGVPIRLNSTRKDTPAKCIVRSVNTFYTGQSCVVEVNDPAWSVYIDTNDFPHFKSKQLINYTYKNPNAVTP